MKPRAILALLAVVASAPLMVACDSTTAPQSSLRAAGSVSSNKISGGDKDACKNGGFANYLRDDGSAFSNQGECVSYVERGGQLMPKVPPLPVITSFTGSDQCLTDGGLGVQLIATFSGGTGTITDPLGAVTPVTTGVQVTLPFEPGSYTLTVTNAAGSVTSPASGITSTGVPSCDGGSTASRGPARGGRIGGD